MRYTNKL